MSRWEESSAAKVTTAHAQITLPDDHDVDPDDGQPDVRHPAPVADWHDPAVYARFLHDLAVLERVASMTPLHDMQWFAPAGTPT